MKVNNTEKDNYNEAIEKFSREIIKYLMKHPDYPKNKITVLKNRLIGKYPIPGTIKNSLILEYATPEELKKIRHVLRRRSTRSIAGVTVVAVMTKPLDCPGNCIFCPGSDSQPGEKAAKSYTGMEPAAKRSILYNYDPYLQTFHRIKDQQNIGHNIDKIDLIIMGGTFLSAPEDYQEWFVKNCYDAIINYYSAPESNIRRSNSLYEAINLLESSKLHLSGLTIETRPDFCKVPHVNRMLEFGTTRVEIGVQTLRDSLLRRVGREHTLQDTIDAFLYAKDAGLKINAHMMPNLPYSTIEEDYKDFQQLFSDANFKPDMIKIYPTLVVKGTELYEMWKKGEYKPYTMDELVDLIAKVKENIPPYVRIQRIQRDIPAYLIEAGVKKSNLRQIVQKYLHDHGKRCNCIRCREHGFIQEFAKKSGQNYAFELENFTLHRFNYEASGGNEIFLSYEDEKALLGYLRLRIPSKEVFRTELKNNTAIVREIRVVGEIVQTGNKPQKGQIQHRGFGKKLLKEAEKIAREEFDCKKIAVISGIGVRQYFYNQGYQLDGPYVSKSIKG